MNGSYVYVTFAEMQEVHGVLLITPSPGDRGAAREIQVRVNCTYSTLTQTCWNRHGVAQTTSRITLIATRVSQARTVLESQFIWGIYLLRRYMSLYQDPIGGLHSTILDSGFW